MTHRANLIKYHPDGDMSQVRYTIKSDEKMLEFMKTGQMISGESIDVESFLRSHRELLVEEKLNNLALDYPEIWDAANAVIYEDLEAGGYLNITDEMK